MKFKTLGSTVNKMQFHRMTRLSAISCCLAALLSACSAGSSDDFPDVQAAVAYREVTASPMVDKIATQPKETKPASEPEAQTSLNELNEVTVFAEPYMSTEYKPRYAILSVSCVPEEKTLWTFPISVSVQDLSSLPRKLEDGTVIHQFSEGDFLTGRGGHFFQRGDVYFDEVKTVVPSIYKEVEKRVSTGPNSYEMQKERVLIGPERAYYDVLLPKLKVSKTMRLHYRSGTGPTFDLTNIKSDIERLEAKCTPKDATNAK